MLIWHGNTGTQNETDRTYNDLVWEIVVSRRCDWSEASILHTPYIHVYDVLEISWTKGGIWVATVSENLVEPWALQIEFCSKTICLQ